MSAFGEALKKACASKDLTREGVDKALLSIDSYDIGFGVAQDFTDPKSPSSHESVILQPDKNVTGGMKVVREAGASEAAKSYTPGA